MLNFRSIEISDMAAIKQTMACVEKPVSAFCFENLFLWQDYYKTSVCFYKDFLFIRSTIFDGSMWGYLQPLGSGDIAEAVGLLKQQADMEEQPLVIFAIFSDSPVFNDFVLLRNRSYADYIYEASALRTLSGKKLQPKRNHLNKFLALYPNVTVRDICSKDREKIENMTLEWGRRKDYPEGELLVIKRLFDNFEALRGDLYGILAEHNGHIIAFSLGAVINGDTIDVMMEKGNTDYEGIYAFINNEFVKHLPETLTYIDREEDMGLPGLRKSKLSYHPQELRLYPTGVEKNSRLARMFIALKQCFGDEDEFISHYLFYYSKPQTRVMLDNENGFVAMFNVHVFKGQVFERLAYLYALGVKPECRGRGYAVEVVKLSLCRAKQNGCVLALTIQANKDFNAWQNVFDFGSYAPYPVIFTTPDDFDFGTGNRAEDIAICRILDVEAYLKAFVAINPSVSATFSFKDKLFPSNTATYIIQAGSVVKLPFASDCPVSYTNSQLLAAYPLWDTNLTIVC